MPSLQLLLAARRSVSYAFCSRFWATVYLASQVVQRMTKRNRAIYQRNMNERVTIEGRWWIFGADKDPHFGVLSYDPNDSTVLTVKIPGEGGIKSLFELFKQRKYAVQPTILGADKNNQPVSIFGCYVLNSVASFGQQDFVIHAMMVVCGLQITAWDELCLDRISAEFTLLHNWVGASNLEVIDGSTTTVTIAELKSAEYALDGNVRLNIWPTHAMHHGSGRLIIEEGHRVEFRFAEPRKVKEILLTHVESFRRFLSLTTGKVVFTDKLYTYAEGGHPEVTFYRGNPGVSGAERKLPHLYMRASYQQIRASFGQVINRWYELESTIDDVLNLYFATIFNRNLYMHQQFLFLAQALEVYHRTSPNYKNMVQSKAEFRARKKQIVKAVPSEKDWLNEKLAHANEKTLAQRLDDLLTTHADDVSQFIEDTKIFADSVRHTRNHFTHYGTEDEQMSKVAQGVDLIKITCQMQALLEICIFKDLGIIGEPIARIIKSSNSQSYCSL